MKKATYRLRSAVLAFCLCVSFAPHARAVEPFTNSATLSVSVEGTNLLLRADFADTNGAYTLLQGDRLDALHLPPCSCQISNQILDLGWVPPARQVQWTLTATPSAQRFFRLQLEPFLTRGRARVFVGEPLDFAAMAAATGGRITSNSPVIYKPQVEVWLDQLGTYDTNGVLVAGNDGQLSGKYGFTYLFSIGQSDPFYAGYPNVNELASPSNDFRVDFTGQSSGLIRESILWASEVQMYHDITDFRTRFFNEQFIDELMLPSEIAKNLKDRQFRPDLVGASANQSKPEFRLGESEYNSGILLNPYENRLFTKARTKALEPGLSEPPLSIAFDTEDIVSDYAGLMAFWLIGTNTGFPGDGTTDWRSNILGYLNDGLSMWVAYRYVGKEETFKYFGFAARNWPYDGCGGTSPSSVPCDKGRTVRNVMMFEQRSSNVDGTFPFFAPTGLDWRDGPVGGALASLYFGALFYDIANEAGLGIHKADLLFWKTVSLITSQSISMSGFGGLIQQSARLLWPDPRPGHAGKSLYEEDLVDVLTSRGIALNGAADFRTNLPPAFAVNSPFLERTNNREIGFATGHPMTQPGVNQYGLFSGNFNGYTFTNTDAHYVAYQFYKHSKLGPADVIWISDGTFNATTGTWNNDSTFQLELTDRTLGNLVVLAPGRTIRWVWKGVRANSEAEGFYAEDVRPFGFRVIQATPNGFSFTVSALSDTPTNKTYQLSIVDPSLATLGAADYQWNFTNHLGTAVTAAGANALYTAQKDEPFTLSITRIRPGVTNTLTLRERGNDLDRSGGNAFVRNLVP